MRRTTMMTLLGGLLVLLALLVPPAPLAAQDAITVSASEARPDFPNQISFSLEAASSAADIVEVQLLYGATRTEVLTIAEPVFTPGQQVSARHELNTQIYHLAPGTDITYRWQIRDAAGNLVTSEPQTLVYHDERFSWRERSERGVTIYWYQGGEAFGDELMRTATDTLDRLQAEIGTAVVDPVKIYVYANIRDMRGALESNEVEWVGGQARPDLGLIIGAIGPGDVDEARRLIPHELSHQVLHQATENPYGGVPLWFDEGLAVYNQEVLDAGFPEMVAGAAREGELIPLAALAASFPADPQLALQSYAQSHSVVAYIIDTYGEAKLQELVVAFREATPLEEALQQVLGLSVDELDAAWRSTLPAPQSAAQPAPAPTAAVAPADRFNTGRAGSDAVNQPLASDDILDTLGLPAWSGIVFAAACLVLLVAAGGAVLLVALRLIGVDKQVQ